MLMAHVESQLVASAVAGQMEASSINDDGASTSAAAAMAGVNAGGGRSMSANSLQLLLRIHALKSMLTGGYDAGGGGAGVPVSNVGTDYLINTVLPLIQDNMSQLEAAYDAAGARSGPKLGPDGQPMSRALRRAIQRRKKVVDTGVQPKSAGASEQGSVFKGFSAKDRRKAHVQELDEAADAYLASAAATGIQHVDCC